MKGRLLTLILLVLFCAATAKSQGPLLGKSITGVNATSNVTVNATLDPVFLLKGTISSSDPASVADSVRAVLSTTSSVSFFGVVDATTHKYRIVLPAGTYNLDVSFTHTVGQQTTSFTFRDLTSPALFTVSADTTRDVTLPAVTTSAVTGTVSNLNMLFPTAQLSFDSNSITGFMDVSANSPLDPSGNYAVQLPKGSFNVTLSQSMLSFTTFFSSDLSTNLGPVPAANPLNFTVPTVSTATLSGTASVTGSSSIPSSSVLLGVDVTGGTAPQTVSSGSGPLPATGAYGPFTFITGRTYALNPSFPVHLLPTPAPPGEYTPPDPSPTLLTADAMRNVNYPALPGPATAVTISGRVTITGTLTPVAHAPVFVDGNQITGAANTSFSNIAKTDAFGNYSLVVPAGMNYTLSFSGSFNTSGDFDGDGKADIGVWRPSNGDWFVIESDPNFLVQQWGTAGDIPVRGDYDGDGKTDVAVFRPSNGTWYIIPSSNPGMPIIQQWGTNGDIPVPGDYDGDGKTDFAVFRPSNGMWFIIPSSNPSTPIVRQWGTNGDIPVPGDYDGDGITDIAVFRPSNGTWFVIPSGKTNAPIIQQWGTSGDMPVPGDYDGDGKTDFAVWRPSNGVWFIIPTSNPSAPIIRQWGTSGDIPVPVDYDRDRKTDIAVWRPSNGVWFIIPSATPGTTFSITQWGTNGDVPLQKPIGQ